MIRPEEQGQDHLEHLRRLALYEEVPEDQVVIDWAVSEIQRLRSSLSAACLDLKRIYGEIDRLRTKLLRVMISRKDEI